MADRFSRRNFLRRLGGAPVIAPAAVGLATSDLWVPETKAVGPNPKVNHLTTLHGAGVQVEYPERAARIQRRAWGTEISQPKSTDNWFHFPIASDPTEWHWTMGLQVWMDFDILIDDIQLWTDPDARAAITAANFPYVGRQVRERIVINLDAWPCYNGLWSARAISVHVKWQDFSAASRAIVFYSAGIGFA
jgi:hypothetical protein